MPQTAWRVPGAASGQRFGIVFQKRQHLNDTPACDSRSTPFGRLKLHLRSSVRSIIVTIIGLILACVCGIAAAAPVLKSDTTEANAGFYRLHWRSGVTKADYELQESTDSAFSDARVIYRGPDLATVISGKRDGVYHYRIRRVDNTGGGWSESVAVTVKHHTLTRAFTIFAIGGAVFAATLWLIISGARRGDPGGRA